MKILMVLSMSLEESGPSIHLLNDIITNGLKQGHQIITIERSSNNKNKELEFFYNSNYTRLIVEDSDSSKKNFIDRYISELIYAQKCKKYYKALSNIDVIFLQSCNNAYFQIRNITKYLKSPIVYNVQDIFPNNLLLLNVLSQNSLIYRLLFKLQIKAYSKSQKIITISDDMKKTLINDGINSYKIKVIYNWGDYDIPIHIPIEENEFVKTMNINKKEFRIVYAGNIGKMQNVQIIIKAAKLLNRYKDIHFYIIGDGNQKKSLKDFTKIHHLNNISFLPIQKSNIAIQIYSMANVNVIPLISGGIYTALPSKTANCLLCQNQIIACIDKKSNFAKRLLQSNNCFVVNSDDSDELANQILKCYKNQDMHNIDDNYLLELFSTKNAVKYIKYMEETYYESIQR